MGCVCREEADEDYTYSVTTRIPQSFPSGRLCYRMEQSYSLGPLVVNTEAVLRIKTSLKNNRTLFTDDNGYQMMKRPSRTFVNDTVARVSGLYLRSVWCRGLNVH